MEYIKHIKTDKFELQITLDRAVYTSGEGEFEIRAGHPNWSAKGNKEAMDELYRLLRDNPQYRITPVLKDHPRL